MPEPDRTNVTASYWVSVLWMYTFQCEIPFLLGHTSAYIGLEKLTHDTTHVCVCNVCVCLRLWVWVCVCVFIMYVHVCIHVCVCVCVYECVCDSVCVRVRVCL